MNIRIFCVNITILNITIFYINFDLITSVITYFANYVIITVINSFLVGWSNMTVCLYHDTGGGRDMRDVIRE